MPDHAAGEGRHLPLAAGLTHPHETPAAARPATPRARRPAAAALRERETGRSAPLRPPVDTAREDPALGRRPAGLRALAAPHHPDLGGTGFRLRCRPRL